MFDPIYFELQRLQISEITPFFRERETVQIHEFASAIGTSEYIRLRGSNMEIKVT